MNGGKIVWAKHSDLQQFNLKALLDDTDIKEDGERLPVTVKDVGACEIYPQTVAHNPNGRFVVVCGDGEYIIYTSMALRNKAFGSAKEFVWALDSSEYAIRESSGTVKCFRNFKERKSFTPDHGAEGKHIYLSSSCISYLKWLYVISHCYQTFNFQFSIFKKVRISY